MQTAVRFSYLISGCKSQKPGVYHAPIMCRRDFGLHAHLSCVAGQKFHLSRLSIMRRCRCRLVLDAARGRLESLSGYRRFQKPFQNVCYVFDKYQTHNKYPINISLMWCDVCRNICRIFEIFDGYLMVF